MVAAKQVRFTEITAVHPRSNLSVLCQVKDGSDPGRENLTYEAFATGLTEAHVLEWIP